MTSLHHDISNPPFCLTSRKPFWRQPEPVDIKGKLLQTGWWRKLVLMRVGRYIMTSPTHHHFAWHPESLCGVNRNQLTSTVNGQNPGSRPGWSMHISWTTPQSDNRALLSLDNSGLSWTISAPDKVTAVPVRRNGNFQTPISVPVVWPKRCHTLSNPAHRQDYTVACLNYTLQTMMLLPGWPAMAPNAYNNNQQYSHCLRSVVVSLVFPSQRETHQRYTDWWSCEPRQRTWIWTRLQGMWRTRSCMAL